MVSPGTTPLRGEVWWVAGPGPDLRQPVLIVQNDVGNVHARTVIVAAVSADVPRKRYPQVVPLDDGLLGRPATVRCDIVRTIEKSRLVERAAVAPRHTMDDIDAALRRSLALG